MSTNFRLEEHAQSILETPTDVGRKLNKVKWRRPYYAIVNPDITRI